MHVGNVSSKRVEVLEDLANANAVPRVLIALLEVHRVVAGLVELRFKRIFDGELGVGGRAGVDGGSGV